MSQAFSLTPRGPKHASISNTVTLAASGNTVIAELNLLTEVEKVSFQIDNTVQALDAFIVEGRVHQDASYFTIASAAGDFSAPSGRILPGVSGAPVTLAASASARFDMDTSGLYSVRVSASAAVDGAVVTIYASGSAGMANTNVSLQTGDLEIGAVEIKNSTDDTRATVGANGLYTDVRNIQAGTAVIGKVGIDQTTPGTTNKVIAGGAGTALAPSTEVVTTQRPAVTQVVSTALEASHILKASAGQLVHLAVFNSLATSQFLLIMNSATLPADGAVTLLYPPIPMGGNSLMVLDLPAPLVASTGIVVCNSSTGSFTKTIGAANLAIYAQVN